MSKCLMKFTQLDGEPIYVNPEDVNVVAVDHVGDTLIVVGEQEFWVTEAVDAVAEAINYQRG
jgi:uncharacterized protein YlzI (FlbEa/FlbD family)